MGLFSIFRKQQEFFTAREQEEILAAIRSAEKVTSGEIRLFVESRCRFVDPIDRAREIFFGLKMEKTDDRNGVLIYIATKDKQIAVFGDEGIHQKVGEQFWYQTLYKILGDFKSQHYAEGLVKIIREVGDALHHHFPYDNDTDKNELPDDIIFGK